MNKSSPAAGLAKSSSGNCVFCPNVSERSDRILQIADWLVSLSLLELQKYRHLHSEDRILLPKQLGCSLNVAAEVWVVLLMRSERSRLFWRSEVRETCWFLAVHFG